MKSTIIIIVVALAILGGFLLYRNTNQFEIPDGETVALGNSGVVGKNSNQESDQSSGETFIEKSPMQSSNRQVFVTDGVKHSIPLDEIISGGPPKDGIPSIDNPRFISQREASKDLEDDSVGLGVFLNGEARFYPFGILVWHELVNDEIGSDPILVSYCPLCATAVVFERRVGDNVQEFGVSGRLWQSNLLMYNRTGNPDTESLWSQVLGEAVLGPETNSRLRVISSDTVRYGDWKKKHTGAVVLSRETRIIRPYGSDPYGSNTPIIGATFNDDRLDAKDFVFGIEINGRFKAYDNEAIPVGTTVDTFADSNITIEKDSDGSVRMFIGTDKEPIQYISGFWFSWVAVHPETELFK